MSHQQGAVVRRRRTNRRGRGRRFVSAVAVFALVALSLWLLKLTLNSRYSTADDLSWLSGLSDTDAGTNSALQAFASAQRPVYPYSIVPGGIQSGEELRRVIEHDSVVASHYAGFDYRHARVIELTEPKLVYLSYRMGNKVFWTHKQITLRKGEKLITDGSMTARTRCANQVSVLPHAQVTPAEPLLALMEQPIPGPVALPNFLPAPYPALSQVPSPAAPPTGYGPPIGVLPPIGNPPTCIPPKNGKPVPGQPKPCPPGPPPPSVPEPATILLFSSGLAGVYLRLRKRSP